MTVKRETSTLVTTWLTEGVPEGVVDGDGTLQEVGAIIHAEGFTPEYLAGWTIVGRDGHKLGDI